MTASIDRGLNEASPDAHQDDDVGADGSVPLLGLASSASLDIEKAGENLTCLTDLDSQPCYAPLLGTIFLPAPRAGQQQA